MTTDDSRAELPSQEVALLMGSPSYWTGFSGEMPAQTEKPQTARIGLRFQYAAVLTQPKVFMSGMITTKDDLSRWFDEGLAQGATHLIVVCNTFSDEDYPLYVEACEDVQIVVKCHDGVNLQEVIEVYNLSVDKDTQLAQERALNY